MWARRCPREKGKDIAARCPRPAKEAFSDDRNRFRANASKCDGIQTPPFINTAASALVITHIFCLLVLGVLICKMRGGMGAVWTSWPPNLFSLFSFEEIENTTDRLGGVGRVQRRKHQMAGVSRVHGSREAGRVAHFTNHDDIGVLPQRVLQRVLKRTSYFTSGEQMF